MILRISEAADVLGVSDDTIRRWISRGRIAPATDASGRQAVDGASLAVVAQEIAVGKNPSALDTGSGRRSARNHLTGLVTDIVSDTVMSQVELQCGPYRVGSLVSTESVRELGLDVGSVATAVIKATNVALEGRAD